MVSYTITTGLVSQNYQAGITGTPTNVVGITGTNWFMVPNTDRAIFFYETLASPLVKQFASTDSDFLWADDLGDNTHLITFENADVPGFYIRIRDRT